MTNSEITTRRCYLHAYNTMSALYRILVRGTKLWRRRDVRQYGRITRLVLGDLCGMILCKMWNLQSAFLKSLRHWKLRREIRSSKQSHVHVAPQINLWARFCNFSRRLCWLVARTAKSGLAYSIKYLIMLRPKSWQSKNCVPGVSEWWPSAPPYT